MVGLERLTGKALASWLLNGRLQVRVVAGLERMAYLESSYSSQLKNCIGLA